MTSQQAGFDYSHDHFFRLKVKLQSQLNSSGSFIYVRNPRIRNRERAVAVVRQPQDGVVPHVERFYAKFAGEPIGYLIGLGEAKILSSGPWPMQAVEAYITLAQISTRRGGFSGIDKATAVVPL